MKDFWEFGERITETPKERIEKSSESFLFDQ